MKPAGIKSLPRHPPKSLGSTADLRAIQRFTAGAIFRPLTAQDGMLPEWVDGRPMEQVAAELIRPNDRLTSFERLEIYNRMYWFRLIDCAWDDCPGLRALLGDERFTALIRAYLTRYPSRSFTLRNLCSRLVGFIADEPRWTRPHTALALEVARFEWAQTEAFDDAALPKLTADDIADAAPSRLRLGLQPYLKLLKLEYPVDDFVIAVKKRNVLRTEASNAVGSEPARSRKSRRVPRPRRGRIYLAVHRYKERLYYKRLERPAFRVLLALKEGRTVPSALAAAGASLKPAQVTGWFSTWVQLGWLCRRK